MKNLIYLFFFINFFSFSQEEKRLALVIGNANYDKGELKNPVNDARLIASTLDSLDFDVILKENLESQTDFKRAILEFGKKRPNYDVAFVYYAGHGVQISDENYLLPTKVEFSSEDEVEMFGVSVQDVMRYLKAQTNEVNILILDACRDNPFESNWNTTRSLKGGGLAKIPPPTGSLIAFSTDSGETAPDGDGDNSVYTTSLSKNMLLEDTSIDQVFRNVRAEVLGKTGGAQRPVESTQLTGQTFYLNPKSIDNFFSLVEGNFNSGKYDKVIFSILEVENLFTNVKFLKLLLESYQILGRNDEAKKIIEKIIENNYDDTSVLEVTYEYYKRRSSKMSFEIVSKIYEIDNSLINKIRKDYYEYKSSDFYYTDNISISELENNLVITGLLRKLKDNHLILNEKINQDKNNDLFHKYLFNISRDLITYNYKKIDNSERIIYYESGLNSIKKLIDLNPENPEYYNDYAYLLDRIFVSKEGKKSIETVDNFLMENIGTTKKEEITSLRDSLIQKSYKLNKLNIEDIILDYFDSSVRTEPKSQFHKPFESALAFINGLIEKQPKNKKFLLKRGGLYSENKKYELAISDEKKVLLMIEISEKYEIMERVNSIAYIYKNYLNDKKTGVELLMKYINQTKIDSIDVNYLDYDEKYLYGEIFNTISEFYFTENDFVNSKKYIQKTEKIWDNNNKLFKGKSFDYFFPENDENEVFYEYMRLYGQSAVINYLVNIYGYYSGANLTGSYLNWISSDYNKSLNSHYESIFYNPYLGDRIYYDYMNLLINLKDENKIKLFSEILGDDVKKSNKEDWTGSTYIKHTNVIKKFIFESKLKDKNINEIQSFIKDKKYKYLFTTLDWRDIINIENKSSDSEFVINANTIEILNLLVTKEMYNEAGELLNEIFTDFDTKNINSIEFLYKASYIKYLLNEKFESYALLNDVRKLLKSRNNIIGVEKHSIGYLDYGLALNFDGISLIKQEDINNLEKLIRE